MATKKQRRRRDKTFRHEHGLVAYDEEGNEIEVTATELRAEKGKPEKPKRGRGEERRGRSRRSREPPRAVLAPLAQARRHLGRDDASSSSCSSSRACRVASTDHASASLYAAAFVPLTYLIDRLSLPELPRRRDKATAEKASSR